MLKTSPEPQQVGSSDTAELSSTSLSSISSQNVIANNNNNTNISNESNGGGGPTPEDREKYKRKIAAMISGVSSEFAERKRLNSPTPPPHPAPVQQASDIRIMKVKAVSMLSQSDNDLSGISLLGYGGRHSNDNTSSGHSRSSSQSGSMCNLLATSSNLGGSQSSLSFLFSSNTMTPSTSNATVATVTPNSPSSSHASNNSNSTNSSVPRPFRVNLAALLNDPRPGKRPIYIFSKLYGESFERAASLPVPPLSHPAYTHPSTRDFSKYLKSIKKRSAQHQKKFDTRQVVERPSSPTSQDLSSVPPEFFQPTFSLSNPDTFYSLFSWLRNSGRALDSLSTSEASKAQSQALHDRLSMYLDIVEAEISRQVSSRSDSFFASMTSQDVLQAYLAQTLVAVKALRTKLKNVHSSFVVSPMEVMRLSATRDRHVTVFKKLRLISTIAGTQSTIQVLLSAGDYSGAIDLIRTTQEVIAEDLSGIVAFRYLPVQLAEVERTIDSMLCDDIRDCLARELNRPPDSGSNNLVLIQDETRLIGIALGLLKLHRFIFLDALQEEAATAVKTVIKSSVIQSVSTSESLVGSTRNSSISLDDQLRQLAPIEWLALVQTMFTNLTALLDRIQAIKSLLMELVLMAAGKSQHQTGNSVAPHSSSQSNSASSSRPESTSTTLIVAAEDSQSLRLPETVFLKLRAQFIDTIYAISDLVQQRCIKVLEIRQQQRTGAGGTVSSDRTSVTDFLTLSATVEKFVSRLAELVERPSRTLPAGSPLPAFVHCQTARFISQFHEERRHKLAEILDTEMWKPAVVPADFQRLMDMVCESKRLVLLPSSPSKESNSSGGSDVAVSTPTKAIRFGDDEYTVAGTALMLFRLIVDYGDCATKMQTSAGDLLNKLVEVLKTYNSRTCQLVLGAGAVQLLGLRTITAGHLALSARSLQFVLCLLPIIRSHFSAILNSPESTGTVPLAKYIDQLEHDYADHVNEIMAKILSVVDGAIGEQFSKWEAKPPVPSPLVKTVCGQLRRLHDSIANITPTPGRSAIFGKVSTSFREQMANRLRQLDIKMDTNTSACGMVSQEIAFFNEQLRSFNLGIANLSIGDFIAKPGK